MKCPYCNEIMKKGKIQVWDTISWIPEGENRSGLTKYGTSKNGKILKEYGMFHLIRGAEVISYMCSKCNKIIIDINEN